MLRETNYEYNTQPVFKRLLTYLLTYLKLSTDNYWHVRLLYTIDLVVYFRPHISSTLHILKVVVML